MKLGKDKPSADEPPKKPRAKKTVGGEIKRNISAHIGFSKELYSGFSGIGSAIKDRRSKSYSVSDDVDFDEFSKRAKIFRRQVFLYAIMAIISFLISPFFIHWYVLVLAGVYMATWYIIYIRDVHRVRLLLRRWELRTTPLALTWAGFYEIVKKSPKYLNPLK